MPDLLDSKVLEAIQGAHDLLYNMQEGLRGAGIKYYVPHPKQAEFIRDCFTNPITWAFCGNRAGKTDATTAVTVIRATGIVPKHDTDGNPLGITWRKPTGQHTIHWISSESGKFQREVIQPKLLGMIPSNMIIGKPHLTAQGVWDYIEVWDVCGGTGTISFRTYEQPADKYAGASIDSLQWDEQPDEDQYKEGKMRTIDHSAPVYGALTPVKGMTWIYEKIFLKNGTDGIRCHNWDMDDNPYISESEKMYALAGLTPDELAIRKSGQFKPLTGLVIPQFNDIKHVLYQGDHVKVPADWFTLVCIDPHEAKPHALLWLSLATSSIGRVRKGDWLAWQECSVEGTVEDMANTIKIMNSDIIPKTYVCDPALNAKDSGNFGRMNVAWELKNRGIRVKSANKDFSAGIQKIRLLLEQEHPRLWIQSTCPTLIDQLKIYRFRSLSDNADKDDSDKVRKRRDDFIDCLRYGLNTGYIIPKHREVTKLVYDKVTGAPLRRVAC